MRDNESIENKISQRLDNAAENIDQASMDRLAQARMAALDAIPTEKPKSRRSQSMWLGAGASLACLVLAAALVWFPTDSNEDLHAKKFEVDEFEVLLDGEDLEMLASDVEFYLWLEDELEENT